MPRRYWLMKSEPEECSIDDALAAPASTIPWTGVRNYQARNLLRDDLQAGDGVLFYHSSCAVPGIAGLAEVVGEPFPDPTQFDPGSPYFDKGSKPEAPRWVAVRVRALRKTRLLPITELRGKKALAGMRLLQKGNRLSVSEVALAEWKAILKMLD